MLVEKSRNVVLGENTFGHNPDYGDRELATGIRIVDSENLNLNGFLIQDAQAGTHTVNDAVPLERDALVELVRCRRVNMTGCQLLDGVPTGLLVDDCRDTLVSACTILDQREERKMKYGIVWQGSDLNGNMMTGCRVCGGVKTGIYGIRQSGNLTD